jgi:ribonuclease PH
MTGSGGIVEIQGTAEGTPFSRNELNALVDLADAGIRQLVAAQTQAVKG